MNPTCASLSQILPSSLVEQMPNLFFIPIFPFYISDNVFEEPTSKNNKLTEARFANAFDFHFKQDWFVTLMLQQMRKKTKARIHSPVARHSFSQASNLFFIHKDRESTQYSARIWQPPLHCQIDAHEYWIIGIIYLSLKIPFSSLITALSESLSSYYGCFWQRVCTRAWQGLSWWSDCWLTVLCGELIESGRMMNVLFEDAQGFMRSGGETGGKPDEAGEQVRCRYKDDNGDVCQIYSS